MKMRKHNPSTSVAVLLAGVVASVTSPALADEEAVIYVVGDHDHTNACGGSDFTWHFSAGNTFHAAFEDWDFDRHNYYSNRRVDQVDSADQSQDSDGEDDELSDGIDTFDVAYYYSHGNRRDCGTDQARSIIQAGENRGQNECSIDMGGDRNDVLWGDTDLNIVMIDTCYSVHKCVWEEGTYFDIVDDEMMALLGFHGISYDSRAHQGNIEDFVSASRTEGLGDNWVDDLTRLRLGSNNDECATVVVYGDDEDETDHYYLHAGLQDWATPDSHSSSSFWFIERCDPRGGERLP